MENASVLDLLIEKHNEYRRKYNLSDLRTNESLMDMAQKHAKWMDSKKKMSHYEGYFWARGITTRARECGYHYILIGENVAYGQRSVDEVMRVWMNSRPHNANILGNFKDIGVGVSGVYWSVSFGKI